VVGLAFRWTLRDWPRLGRQRIVYARDLPKVEPYLREAGHLRRAS
jgi:hypothetical protein